MVNYHHICYSNFTFCRTNQKINMWKVVFNFATKTNIGKLVNIRKITPKVFASAFRKILVGTFGISLAYNRRTIYKEEKVCFKNLTLVENINFKPFEVKLNLAMVLFRACLFAFLWICLLIICLFINKM